MQGKGNSITQELEDPFNVVNDRSLRNKQDTKIHTWMGSFMWNNSHEHLYANGM